MDDIVKMREEATAIRDAHDPDKQKNGYRRCEHCHYTRHPCEAYSQADAMLSVLAEVERLRAIVDRLPKTADGVPIAGYWASLWWVAEDIDVPCHAKKEGDIFWYDKREWMKIHEDERPDVEVAFSTRETAENARAAALAAKGEGKG